ncbi:hypothetical protein VF21_09433 [Pseudogymnoascus sp. 05NY08]|nr:hypothetical protein VF21_09433 [Pseudogymnoascus sp. 05NY08]
MGFKKIVIVGAGPAGLLLALLLAKKGISVTILDAAEELDKQPRATHYGAPAVAELRRAGVIDDVRAEGFIPRKVCWRKIDTTYLTGIDCDHLGDHPDRMTMLPLNKLGHILYKHLLAQPAAEVLFNHKVVSQGQDAEKAWVEVKLAGGEIKNYEADYIIGCDGANSQVRRSLFGDRAFPGKTWDEQLVATNASSLPSQLATVTYYDFTKYGYEDANFIIHPHHWYMASRISNDGLWRVTYGEPDGYTRDELIARQPEKFRAMLPGNPTTEQYTLANISPYKVHQRLAESMRVGRFLLAADAAHLCNPMGGLGLTGGIVDVGGLYDCLLGIYEGKAGKEILNTYSDVRRAKYNDIVDPISSENLVRVFESDPETVLETDKFFQMCKRAETDLEFSKEFQNASFSRVKGINVLKYDFTEHYIGGPKYNAAISV